MHLKKPHLIKHKQRFSRKRFTKTNKRRRHFSTKNKNNKNNKTNKTNKTRKHHFLSVALFDDSKNDDKNVDKKIDGKNDGNIITGLRDFLKKI